jgi:beta-lactamase superfamily II metal-dependent hydrolase
MLVALGLGYSVRLMASLVWMSISAGLYRCAEAGMFSALVVRGEISSLMRVPLVVPAALGQARATGIEPHWGCACGMLVTLGLALGLVMYPAAVRSWDAVQALAPGRGWPDEAEVRILDIGQGNAVLIRTPDRHAMLFDGGPAGCDLAKQLHDLGVRSLDAVVISHPHADHFAGLLEAVDELQVGTLIDQVQVVPGVDSETTMMPRCAGAGERRHLNARNLRRGREDYYRYVLARHRIL